MVTATANPRIAASLGWRKLPKTSTEGHTAGTIHETVEITLCVICVWIELEEEVGQPRLIGLADGCLDFSLFGVFSAEAAFRCNAGRFTDFFGDL